MAVISSRKKMEFLVVVSLKLRILLALPDAFTWETEDAGRVKGEQRM
jgi:hypothetical protein